MPVTWFTRPGGWVVDGTAFVNNGTFELYRTGSTLYFKVNGVQLFTTSDSGTLTQIKLRHDTYSNGGANATTFDNLTVLDGLAGNELYRDFSGDACV